MEADTPENAIKQISNRPSLSMASTASMASQSSPSNRAYSLMATGPFISQVPTKSTLRYTIKSNAIPNSTRFHYHVNDHPS